MISQRDKGTIRMYQWANKHPYVSGSTKPYNPIHLPLSFLKMLAHSGDAGEILLTVILGIRGSIFKCLSEMNGKRINRVYNTRRNVCG